jgi:hypothetical protein
MLPAPVGLAIGAQTHCLAYLKKYVKYASTVLDGSMEFLLHIICVGKQRNLIFKGAISRIPINIPEE